MFNLGPAILLFYGFEYNTIIGLTDNLVFGARPTSYIYLFVLVFMDLDDHVTGSRRKVSIEPATVMVGLH